MSNLPLRVLSRVMRKLVCSPGQMRSADNRGVIQSRLYVLHIHVLFAASLGISHMTQPRADQHESGVPVRESSRHTRPVTDTPVQALDCIVGSDTRPVLTGEIAVGQWLLNAVLDLPGGLLQIHGSQLDDHGFRLFVERLFALLRVDRLEHFRYNFDLGARNDGKHIAVEMHCATLLFGLWEHLAHGLQHSLALVTDDELYTVQPPSAKPLEEADPAIDIESEKDGRRVFYFNIICYAFA